MSFVRLMLVSIFFYFPISLKASEGVDWVYPESHTDYPWVKRSNYYPYTPFYGETAVEAFDAFLLHDMAVINYKECSEYRTERVLAGGDTETLADDVVRFVVKTFPMSRSCERAGGFGTYNIGREAQAPETVCPAGYSVGMDENNDGVYDVCVPDPCSGDEEASATTANNSSSQSSLWDTLVSGLQDLVGNPISCSSGRKIQSDVIYTSSGSDPLSYVTHYESPVYENGSPNPTDIWNVYNGFGRTDSHFKKLDTIYANNDYKIYRINSKNKAGHYFSGVDGNLKAKYKKSGSLIVEADGSYTHSLPSGVKYSYNPNGQLVTKISATGFVRKYVYHSSGELHKVTNHFGKTLAYDYNSGGLVSKITTPDNSDYLFNYDAAKNLIKITYPDNTPGDLADNPAVQYLFENSQFPNHLTGKINEKGIRVATWHYDANGKAISSEHANGLEKVELDFSVEDQTKVKRYISSTKTNEVIYHYKNTYVNAEHQKQLVSYEQLACTDCTVGSWNYGYDANGYLAKSTSPSGVTTQFTHDANGFETQRITGVGTPDAQTIDTVWDTTKRQVTKTTKDNLKTEYFYNANSQLSSVTLTDLVSGETRTTTYTYNSDGLVETIDGPRTDVSDLTTYGYDSAGNVNTITNALNHVVTLDNYDASGRVGQVTDANGIATTMTYTPRGWLATTTVNSLTTEYQYYATGSLKKVLMPAGQTLTYFYDDGERLTAVEDNAGNRMEYTLDLMGNITKSEIKDPQGVVKFSQAQVFNALGQLAKTLGNNGQFTESSYDADGSVTTSANAKSQTTSSTLDAIKRVTKTVDAAQGETSFAYNQKNQITKVTDPEHRETIYEY
ncbi:MAG: hypothetical protein OQK04_20030, partial [Kangiellaceae bacterium]|nr:hypothetical protein [Kangiellaceae bacterium]